MADKKSNAASAQSTAETPPKYFAAEEFLQCAERLRALPLDPTIEPDLIFAPTGNRDDGPR